MVPNQQMDDNNDVLHYEHVVDGMDTTKMRTSSRNQ